MHNNEFEKRVGHKLEELTFTPSDAVWQRVELQIRERKRRKRFLFWWLPGILLCTGILGWYISSLQTGSNITGTIRTEEKPLPSSVSENHQQKSVEPVTATKQDDKKGSDQSFNTKPVEKIKNSVAKTEIIKNTAVVNSSIVKTSKQNFKTQPTQFADSNSNAVDLPSSPLKNYVKPVVVAEPPVEQKKDTVDALTEKPVLKEEEKTATGSTDSTASTAMKTEVAPPAATVINKKKTELSVVFSGGSSDMSRFSAGLFHTADRVYSAPSTSGPGYPAPAAASDIKAGAGFSAGLQLKLPLEKRTAFSVGLAYAFYSASHTTGTTVYASAQYYNNVGNVVVDRYTNAGNNNVFHSRYHFIELPLNYHLQLSREHKRPVSFHTGITYSYLAGSNAMYFHQGTGSYYYDAALFSRSQLQMQAGFSFALVKQLNYPLTVGVQYKYGLTGQWKKSLDLNQHLSFTGIRLSWTLKSK